MKIPNTIIIFIALCAVFGKALLAANTAINPVTMDLPKAINHTPANKELAAIDLLIQATGKSLEDQKQLRQLIIDYQQLQCEYLMHEDDADLLLRTARAGHRVLEKINENYLTHNFDPEFISELTLFSNVACKRGIPK